MLLELKLVADPQNWAAIPSSECRPSEVIVSQFLGMMTALTDTGGPRIL